MAKKNNKPKKVGRSPRFARATKPSKPATYKTDKRGTVRIRLALADPDNPNNFLANNMTKQLSVRDATVGEVRRAIEKLLFANLG